MILSTSGLAEICKGKLTGEASLEVSGLLTDSRNLSNTEGQAFFAIRGLNHDGHEYIHSLYERGIRIFVVENIPARVDLYKKSAFIQTDDSIKALQNAASFKRTGFRGRVFAITGSSGKTIVKEWLADLMGTMKHVLRSPKSYNSQIGVPLSVWRLSERYDAAIFEAGISLMGEMERLEKIISPDVGILTNIGDAHSENFPDRRTKTIEKLKLFHNCSSVVYCSDDKLVQELIKSDKNLKTGKLIDWSFENPDSKYRLKIVSSSSSRTELEVRWDSSVKIFTVPFADRASVENAVTAAVVCLEEGMTPENLEAGLLNLAPVAMRMDLKAGINECQLIEDYYNSDPGSLRMALDFMRSGYQRKLTLILSDFIQSGRDEAGLFTEVSELIKKTGINRLIGIGDVISRNRDLFPPGSIFFRNTEDFISSFSEEQFRGEIILLKGARKFEFEKISRLLSQKVHQTFLEVNLDAISHNLNEFRKKLKPGTRILAMVKAFAYGAGAVEISSLLAWHRVDYLSVAIADEGVELRNAGIALPIIVMNPVPDAFSLMIKYNLEPEIYSLSLLKKFSKVAASHGLADYPVHIKIDTGMHRLGLFPAETDQLLTELSKSDNLKVSSVFSHLSASEDPEKDNFTHKQARTLLEVSEKIKKGLGYSFLLHLLNTSGIVRFPEYQFDMVRPGIGLYGAAAPGGIDLKAAGRYCTTISQVKTVAAGEPVGYGCLDISETERQIAILPVGYADGLDRRMGMGAGKLFIRNQYVKIIGNICMDMCMADVTGLNAVEGDEAEIFGNNIKVEEVAAVCGTIPYEILTSIPERVRRVFYRE